MNDILDQLSQGWSKARYEYRGDVPNALYLGRVENDAYYESIKPLLSVPTTAGHRSTWRGVKIYVVDADTYLQFARHE